MTEPHDDNSEAQGAAVRPSPAWLACGLSLVLLAGCPQSNTGSQEAPKCTDTCESLGMQCGSVCGQDCGTCGQDEAGHELSCVRGRCHCVPQCGAESCGRDDGCGYTCPCPGDVSCADCALRLVKVSQRTENGVVEQVTVAVESTSALVVKPRLADLHIAVDQPMTLERVQLGAALGSARKLLHRFTGTNLPYQQQPDGSWRIMVMPGPRNAEVEAGQWLVLTFTRQPGSQQQGPVSFRLLRHDEVLAPGAANQSLQATAYDSPLAVSATRW
ncbi:MAG: hypothetical protein AB2A00_18330 [Myxococcota bacterium]